MLTATTLTEDRYIKGTIKGKFKRAAIIGSSSALILATPAAVVGAHSDSHRGGDDHRHSRSEHRERRDDNNRSWWRFFDWRRHDRDNKDESVISQELCNQYQDRLNDRVENYKTRSQKDVAFMSSYYTMVQEFVTSQNLTVDNYDELKARVEAKQVSAATAVDNIEAANLNCDEQTEASVKKQSKRLYAQSVAEAKKEVVKYYKALRTLTNSVRDSYDGEVVM